MLFRYTKVISSRMMNWKSMIDKEIGTIVAQIKKPKHVYNDILLRKYIASNQELFEKTHAVKCVQMRIGTLWQRIFGYIPGVVDLQVGHPSGLDLLTTDTFRHGTHIIELKNAYNTDNASSRRQNLTKLSRFTKDHPEYTPIYAVINDTHSKDFTIHHEGIDIRYISKHVLFEFMFGDIQYTNLISYISERIYASLSI